MWELDGWIFDIRARLYYILARTVQDVIRALEQESPQINNDV
jgi:hypothetical protein